MKRQITESEKNILLEKHKDGNGNIRCFVDNETIEDIKDIHFDHIIPFVKSEDTSLDNIAPVCRKHNLAKKDMSLSEYRDKLKIEKIFSDFDIKNKQVKLNDILAEKFSNNFGFPISYEIDNEKNEIEIKYFLDRDKIALPTIENYKIYECPVTKISYFYALIPVKNIINDGKEESDLELQPRPLILEHLWNLYKHLRINTQLQPSICRIDGDNPIMVFDGQHKAAAKIFAGSEKIDVKIYIEPNVIVLLKTNLVAHDKLKQLRFYASILADKMSQIYGANWQKYIETTDKKSEKGFCNFIKYAEISNDEKPEKQIEAFLITSILKDEKNIFSQFVAPENKTGKQYVMSRDSLLKYYFRYFLTKPPLTIEIDSKEDFRNQEIENNIIFFNLLANELLINKWNPDANDDVHKKAERIFRIGSIMVWFPMLRDVVFNKLDLFETKEKDRIFFRNIADKEWDKIRIFVNKMFAHKIWIERDPNIDVFLSNKKVEITDKLFKEKGFTIQWILI